MKKEDAKETPLGSLVRAMEGSKEVEIELVSGETLRGLIIGIDEHVNIALITPKMEKEGSGSALEQKTEKSRVSSASASLKATTASIPPDCPVLVYSSSILTVSFGISS